MADYYDDEGSEEPGMVDPEVDVPEEKLGLVPMSFFKNDVKPGDRESIEVVKIYDNEVAIKCVYSDKDKEESADEDDMEMVSASDAEADELMG